jgi:hypothetical protein
MRMSIVASEELAMTANSVGLATYDRKAPRKAVNLSLNTDPTPIWYRARRI